MNSAAPSPARQAYLLANRRQNRQVHLWQIALLLGLLALWELSCRMGLSDGFLTSCPSRMAATFAALCRSGDLWRHIGVSCGETVIGFLSGTAMGTVVAICMWWSGKLARIPTWWCSMPCRKRPWAPFSLCGWGPVRGPSSS